ncbi:MAG: arginase family protein, partial [Phycisphaerales bacterium]
MTEGQPPTPAPSPIAPARFAGLIRRDAPAGCRVGLIGMPDDLGVRMNSGRPGAAGGPSAFREALAKYGVSEPHGWKWPAVYDAGDITPAAGDSPEALAQTHAAVSEAARRCASEGLVVAGIGGGHDL